MTWKTILVPHDFSASADRAVQIAREEARLAGGRIVLLHVVELVPHFGPERTMMMVPGTTEVISERRHFTELAEARLQVLTTELTAAGIAATMIVRSGVPYEHIREVARDQRADVIIMGTHGRTGIRHLIMGSVAERLVRTSDVPVLTIRHPDQPSA